MAYFSKIAVHVHLSLEVCVMGAVRALSRVARNSLCFLRIRLIFAALIAPLITFIPGVLVPSTLPSASASITAGALINLDASNASSYSGSGINWNDLSGNGAHATLINSPTFDATNKAISWGNATVRNSPDANGTYATVSNFYSGSWSNGFSVSFYANMGSARSYSRVFDFSPAADTNGSPNNINVHREGTSQNLRVTYTSNTSVEGSCRSGSIIEDNVFHHYAITISSAGACTFYKNGTSNSTSTMGGNSGFPTVPTAIARGSAYLARAHWNDPYTDGKLRNIAIYNFVLSGAQLTANYNAQSASVSATVPGAPTGVSGTVANASSVVSWSAPGSNGGSAITGYTVTSTPSVSAPASCTNTANLSCTFTGLTNGTAYTFSVIAINTVGNSTAGTSASVTPRTVPAAPTSVAGTVAHASSVVSWSAPGSNGGSAITGYTVTSTPSVSAPASCTNTSNLSCTFTGLTNGTAYTFSVIAMNAAGNSTAGTAAARVTPVSNVATLSSVTIKGQNPTLGTPNSTLGSQIAGAITLTSVQAASNSLTSTFTKTDAGATISRIVKYDTGTATTNFETDTTFTNGATSTVSNSDFFIIKVTAENGTVNYYQINVRIGTAPNAPTVSTPTALSTTSISIPVSAPIDNGGFVITGYTATSTPGGITATLSQAGSGSLIVTGLSPGTAYTFTVRATNSSGTSAPSTSTTSVSTQNAPAPNAPGFRSARVKVIADNDYAVYMGNDLGITRVLHQSNVVWMDQVANIGTLDVFPLAGETYMYVLAMGGNPTYLAPGAGAGAEEDWTGTINGRSVFDFPGAQVAIGRSIADPTKTDIIHSGYLLLNNYLPNYVASRASVEAGTYSVDLSTANAAVKDVTWGPATLAEALNGTIPYKTSCSVSCRVIDTGVAIRGWDFPDQSAVIFRYPLSGAQLPVTAGDKQVIVDWDPPVGGGDVAKYLVDYKETSEPDSSFKSFSEVASATTIETVTGLTNGTSYTFRVTAVNSGGTASSVSRAVTPTGTPSRPLNLSYAAGAGFVDVSFTAPENNGGFKITNYSYSIDNGSTWITHAPQSTISPLRITGLTDGTTYQIKLKAINPSGAGAESLAVSAKPGITINRTITYASGTLATVTGLPAGGTYVAGNTFIVAAGPARPFFTFTGWKDGATSYQSGDTFTVAASNSTLTAQWIQDSLLGTTASDKSRVLTWNIVADTAVDATVSGGEGNSVRVQIPANALAPGTEVIFWRLLNDNVAKSKINNSNSYLVNLAITWSIGDDVTTAKTVQIANAPIVLTVTNGSIKAGATAWQIIGDNVRVIGTASQDGILALSFTEDPVIAAANVANPPVFGATTSTADGFTVSITNYDAAYVWETPTVSVGTVAITSTVGISRLLTVTGLTIGQSATVTQTNSLSGVNNSSRTSTVTGNAIVGTALTPVFGSPTSTSNGFTVMITNYDAAYTWATPTVNSGSIAVTSTNGSNRLLTVTGLNAGASATIMQTTSRTGYAGGSSSVSGSANTAAPIVVNNPADTTPAPVVADGSAILAAAQAEAARIAAERAEAARIAAEIKAAEVAKAKSDLKNILQSDGKPSLDIFITAGIEGITQKNVEKVTEKILTLPVEQRSNPASIEKMITVVTFFDPQTPPVLADFVAKGIGTVTNRTLSKVANELLTVPESQQGDLVVIKQIVQRVATVDKLSTPGTSKSVQASDLVAIGALSSSNPKKFTITSALKKLEPTRINTYQKLLAEIAKQEDIIKVRAEKSAAIKAKLAARRSKSAP